MIRIQAFILLLAGSLLALSSAAVGRPVAQQPKGGPWKASGKQGAVAAGGQGAVDAGMTMLKKGGNAADAAAATILALTVMLEQQRYGFSVVRRALPASANQHPPHRLRAVGLPKLCPVIGEQETCRRSLCPTTHPVSSPNSAGFDSTGSAWRPRSLPAARRLTARRRRGPP